VDRTIPCVDDQKSSPGEGAGGFGDVGLVFLFLCAGMVITASPQCQQLVAASLQFLLLTIGG